MMKTDRRLMIANNKRNENLPCPTQISISSLILIVTVGPEYRRSTSKVSKTKETFTFSRVFLSSESPAVSTDERMAVSVRNSDLNRSMSTSTP